MQTATLRFWASSLLLILIFSFFAKPAEKEIDLISISQKPITEKISELESILNQNSSSVSRNSILLLLGKSYIENKEFLKAEKVLSEKELLNSDLGEYATYFLISAKTGQNKNLFFEDLWRKLADAEGEPSFRNEALKNLADYYLKIKNYQKAVEFLEKLAVEEKENAELISNLALCYAETKKEREALFYAKKLYLKYPLNKASVDFFKQYPLLLGKMAESSNEEKKERLFVLENVKGFFSLEKDLKEAQSFLDDDEKTFFNAAILSFKGNKFEAITKYLSLSQNSPLYSTSLLRAAQNVNSISSKTLELEKKVTSLTECSEKEKSLSILFNLYKKMQFDDDAIRVAKELLRFSNADASEFLFKKAFENYLNRNKKGCAEILKEMVASLPKDNDYHQAALFSLIKMDRFAKEEKEAAKRELLNSSKYGYYGYKLRKGALPKIEAESQFLPPYIPNPVPKSRVYKANLLLESGLTDEALSELEAVLSKDEKPEILWQMALAASKAMIYPKSVRAVRKLYPGAYSEEGDKIPLQAWEMLYPVPYYECFEKVSEENKMPIILLLSIARQESLFDKKAVSKANAMGIIQLIPSTAVIAAKKAGLPFSSKEQLFDVEYNLKIGSTYFLSVYENFNKNLVSALGGYNAGPGNMKNWRNRQNNPVDEELFIESIPFKETRTYIKRILNNISEYERIYPELKNKGGNF